MNLPILKNTDVYLIDQILKNRYKKGERILDAGCGSGRNIPYFNANGFNIDGVDMNPHCIENLQQVYPKQNFAVANLSALPYEDAQYAHIICNAVLHFAKCREEFNTMVSELARVAKRGASLFVRMTCVWGMETTIQFDGTPVILPDGSTRYLLDAKGLDYFNTQGFQLEGALKTTLVVGQRSMATLLFVKN